MRKVTVALTGGLASVVMMLALHSRASADLSLAALQGSYSETGQGSFSACLLPPSYNEVPCSTSGALPFRLLMPGPGRLPQVHRVLRAQPALWSPLIFLLVLPRLLFPQCTKSLR